MNSFSRKSSFPDFTLKKGQKQVILGKNTGMVSKNGKTSITQNSTCQRYYIKGGDPELFTHDMKFEEVSFN